MKTLRPGGSDLTPELPDEDNRETGEKKLEGREVLDETANVDKAAFAPREVIEEEGDLQQAEEIEKSFIAAVETTEVETKPEDEPEVSQVMFPTSTKGTPGVAFPDLTITPPPSENDLEGDPLQSTEKVDLGMAEVVEPKTVNENVVTQPLGEVDDIQPPVDYKPEVPITEAEGVSAESGDIDAAVQWVLRESYMETTKDLQFHANKVKHFNDMKDAVRDYVTQLRDVADTAGDYATAEPPEGSLPESSDLDDQDIAEEPVVSQESFKEIALDEYSTQKPEDTVGPKLDHAQLDVVEQVLIETIDAVEKQIEDEGGRKMDGSPDDGDTGEEEGTTDQDDAQLANVDLQNSLQKQQQTFQMLSNVSKLLLDTAMAVIRKIG